MLVGFPSKKATAICTFAYSAGPGSEPLIFEGRTEGQIVEARGQTKFGWDPIFLPDGFKTTYVPFMLSTGCSVHSQARLFPLGPPSAVTDNTCTDPHALLSALAGTRKWTVRQRTRSRIEVEPSRSSRHTWRLSLSRASHIRE
jgi:hypothetical protein